MTTSPQIRQIISDVLGVPASALTPTSSPDTIESWDSVQHLSLVMTLESSLGVQFAPEDIEKMRSVGAIETLIASKRA